MARGGVVADGVRASVTGVVRDDYASHAGGSGGLNPGSTVLEYKAFAGRNSESRRGNQKGIGVRLPAFIIPGANHHVKKVINSNRSQCRAHNAVASARCHGNWTASLMQVSRDGYNRGNGAYAAFVQEFAKISVAAFHRLVCVEIQIPELVDCINNFTTGASSPGVKEFAG